MTIQQDFISYHKSIGGELKIAQNRIRDLIGRSHFQTDGEHKEFILRKVITNYAPEIFRIGTGFVCYPNQNQELPLDDSKNSGQIDILITSRMKPTLYKSDELHFVTSDSVEAIIEVKSKVANGEKLKSTINKLSLDVKRIRERSSNHQKCWAGLFIYDKGELNDTQVLEMLQLVTNNDPLAAINCISIGENLFIRFWENGHPISNLNQSKRWHSYELQELSQAYFISNLISHLSFGFEELSEKAWFPIVGTKEINRLKYAELTQRKARCFE